MNRRNNQQMGGAMSNKIMISCDNEGLIEWSTELLADSDENHLKTNVWQML